MKDSLLEKITQLLSDDTITLHQVFESKKNTVALISYRKQERIIKMFQETNTQNINTEIRMLQNLSDQILVPRILEYRLGQPYIIMEYIPGTNLCDYLHDSQVTQQEKTQIMHQCATWFTMFHQKTRSAHQQQVKGDAHIRNFIISPQGVIGVDFEESHPGEPSTDIALFCCSLLLSDPVLTPQKMKFCQTFNEKYERQNPGSLQQFWDIFYTTCDTIIRRRTNSQELFILVEKNMDDLKQIISL